MSWYPVPIPSQAGRSVLVTGANAGLGFFTSARLARAGAHVTLSGRSARLISAHRPTVPIYALSPGRETVRRCGLMWGVQAASMRRFEVTEQLIRAAVDRTIELGWVKEGDRVGVTAGLPSGKPGTTSLLQIQEV